MAEWLGLKKQHPSSAELSSAASSEFEEVGLEELGLQASPGTRASTAAEHMAHDSHKAKPLPGSNVAAQVPAGLDIAPANAMSRSSSRPGSAGPQQVILTEGDHKEAFDPFKDIESATQKAAEMARDAAKEVSSKLFGGAADARTSLTRLAGDVTSWWANFDPSPQPAALPGTTATGGTARQASLASQAENHVAVHAGPQQGCHTVHVGQASMEVQQRFGLPETEELVEQLSCTLVQVAQCSHNTFTPHLPVRFRGALYITGCHACFHASQEHLKFCIELRRLTKVAKACAPPKVTFSTASSTGDEPALRLSLGANEYVIFEAFEAAGLDSALGLIEHLATEGRDHS